MSGIDFFLVSVFALPATHQLNDMIAKIGF
jgi:hypothetical protein